LQERFTAQTGRIRRCLKANLRTGLSAVGAGRSCSTLTGPELYHRHTVDLGWTPERHQRWLTRLLEAEQIGPDLTLWAPTLVGAAHPQSPRRSQRSAWSSRSWPQRLGS
jgi:hypothetical protein